MVQLKKCIVSELKNKSICLTPSLRNLCELVEKYSVLKEKEKEMIRAYEPNLHYQVILPGYMEIDKRPVHFPPHSLYKIEMVLLLVNIKQFFGWFFSCKQPKQRGRIYL